MDELQLQIDLEVIFNKMGLLDVGKDKIQEIAKELSRAQSRMTGFGASTESIAKAQARFARTLDSANVLGDQYVGLITDLGDGIKDWNDLTKVQQKELTEFMKVADDVVKFVEEHPELLKEFDKGQQAIIENFRQKRDILTKARLDQLLYDRSMKTSSVTAKEALLPALTAIGEVLASTTTGSENAKQALDALGKAFSPFRTAGKLVKKQLDHMFATSIKHLMKLPALAGRATLELNKLGLGQKILGGLAKGARSVVSGLTEMGKKSKMIQGLSNAAGKFSKSLAGSKLGKTVGGGLARIGAGAKSAGGGLARILGGLMNMARIAGPAIKGLMGVAAAIGAVVASIVTLGVVLVVLAAFAAFAAMMVVLAKGIRMNAEVMEQYRTANFRAIGSIRGLTDATHALVGDLGVTAKVAGETIKALSHAGITASDLTDKLKTASGGSLSYGQALAQVAKTNLMFAHSTGASAAETGKLQKLLIQTNVSAEQQHKLFGALASAAAEFGLSGEDLNSVMSTLAENTYEIAYVFGQEAMPAFMSASAEMAGLAKNMGLGVGEANKFMGRITEMDNKLIMLAAASGKAFDPANPIEFAARVGQGAKQMLDSLKDLKGVEGALARERVARAFGGVKQMELAMAMNDKIQKMMQEQNITEKEAINILQTKRAEEEALTQQYNQSMQTLTQQMNRLFGPILQVIAELAGPVVDELIKAFDELIAPIKNNKEYILEKLKPAMISLAKAGVGVAKNMAQGFLFLVTSVLPFVMRGIGYLIDGVATLYEMWIKVKGLVSDTSEEEATLKGMRAAARELKESDKALTASGKEVQQAIDTMGKTWEGLNAEAKASTTTTRTAAAVQTEAARRVATARTQAGGPAPAAPTFTAQVAQETVSTNELMRTLVDCCKMVGQHVSAIAAANMTPEQKEAMLQHLSDIALNTKTNRGPLSRRPCSKHGRGENLTGIIGGF